MSSRRSLFLVSWIILGAARPASALLDQSFFVPAQGTPNGKLEEQSEQSHPMSLTYTLELSTTQQITHSSSLSTGVNDGLTLLADASYLHQTSQPSVYTGDMGFQAKLSQLFSLKLLLTGNRTSVAPLTVGGNSTLDTAVSSLWNGRLHTRLQLGFGVSQIWQGPSSDPFGLDQTIYQTSETAGIFQEVAPQVEAGVTYSRFGMQQGQAARDTYTFSLQSQWSPQFSTSFNLSAISDTGPQRSISFGTGFTFIAPSQHWSLGAHGSAFQQTAGATDSSATSSPSRGLTLVQTAPTGPRLPLGYSGGLDIGFYW